MEGVSGLFWALWAPKLAIGPIRIRMPKYMAVKTTTAGKARTAIFFPERMNAFIIGGDPHNHYGSKNHFSRGFHAPCCRAKLRETLTHRGEKYLFMFSQAESSSLLTGR
jgi:hypothetical protein